MKKLITLLINFTLCVGIVFADDLEEGNAAYLKEDYTTAFSKYKNASLQGNANAQLNLAIMYQRGLGVSQDYSEALRLYKLSAEQGNAGAQINLGLMYLFGNGVNADYTEAIRLSKLSAEQGNYFAQYILGFELKNVSRIEAINYFKLSAAQGYAPAQRELAQMHYLGLGVQQDLKEAVRLFSEAAIQGDAQAQFTLGYMNQNAEGFLYKNNSEAFRLYKLAAEQGYASAQTNLAIMYSIGLGIGKNYQEAERWYKLAASQGASIAQVNLGVMYENGEGVLQDYAEAMRLYKLAAIQGQDTAQVNLGSMYANGKGHSQDNIRAYMWFNIAAATGNATASKNREIVIKQMNSQQLAQAQIFAQQCKLNEFKNCGDEVDPLTPDKNISKFSNASSPPVVASDLNKIMQKNKKRIALVIGNANYTKSPLQNTINDANDVSDALKQSGFEVIELRNATLVEMTKAIREYGDKLLRSDVGLVYFSGHGIEAKGRNYLLPINANMMREDEIAFQAIDANLILEKMNTAHKSVNILIIDACRDNPFARSFRGVGRGLAQMDAPTGTIVAFSTAPGKTASDGSGRNSPFTKYLVKSMLKSNLPIEAVFKEVRKSVLDETKGQQTPWESSSLIGDFYFKVSN